MFDLKRPCHNCPFRKGQGHKFSLGTERVMEIMNASAFQCHKTVDYDQWEDADKRQGDKPQQCVGVMSLLHRANLPNQIMQIAERTGYVDFSELDHGAVYDNIADALEAHSWGDWAEEAASYYGIERETVPPKEPTRARFPRYLVRAWERQDYSPL